VLEVEGQDWQPLPLSEGHDASVGKTEVEISEAKVDLDRAPKQACRNRRERVLAGRDGSKERPRRHAVDPRTEELVDLDDHRPRDEQLAAELGDERRSEAVRTIAPVGGRDERPGVGDDLQREVTSSRR
jgi:hypothetical protein